MTEADKRILECLETHTSFLLDAGAGSGKTSSLIRALNYIRGSERNNLMQNSQRVACITFTNVAKDEIIERTEHDAVFQVSTIHDFLWGNIRHFQKDLKNALLIFNDELPSSSRRKYDAGELNEALANIESIVYSDRGANFLEGRIFHDDLLGVAHVMFRRHPSLCKIVAAKFPFIFVDEYQDTHEKVISILMDYLYACENCPVIGFFGDKFQSIYPDVVGEMPAKHQSVLTTIKKEENYRCSKAVIALLNKIRTDIHQVPAGDNVDGAAWYVNLSGLDADADLVAKAQEAILSKFGKHIRGELKTLFLTHRLIARKAGYEALWTVYNERGTFTRERFQSGEDPIAHFLCDRIDRLVEAWREGRIGQAISLVGSEGRLVASRNEKGKIKKALDELAILVQSNAAIGDVLRHVATTELLPLLDDLKVALEGNQPAVEEGTPEAEHRAFMAKLLAIPYGELANFRAVLENNLPYSTKHGVKGDEFENVFVILDDAGANWNQYSFGKLLAGTDTSESRLHRTRNLFYVCCSRARASLVIIDTGSPTGKRKSLETLFGAECLVGAE